MHKNDNVEIMDQRTMPYTMVDNDIFDSMSFEKPIDKLLYMTLCRFSHMQQIYPSIGKLMLMVGVASANTLKDSLKRLEGLKLIRVINRGRNEKTNEHRTHQYVLLKVPNEVRENSVFEQDKVSEVKNEIKKRQKEKAEKSKKKALDKGSEGGPSKNDGPPSKFDRPPSKNDGPPSKFDGNQSRVYKKESTNKEFTNLSISISDSKLPEDLQDYLQNMKDRLIDLDIKVKDIENNYIIHKNDNQVTLNVYIGALDFALKNKSINDLEKIMSKNIRNQVKYLSKSEKAPDEVLPEWFKAQQEQKAQGTLIQQAEAEAAATTEVDTTDIANRIQRLTSGRPKDNGLSNV